MIPTEAVEAAAEWLPHSGDCETRPERDCTCWQSRVDLIRLALEAAAPHMLHDAWEAGCNEGLSWNPGYDDEARAANPYRTAK